MYCVVRDGTLLRRLSPGLAHGKIVLGERFGGVEWSPDETTLLYVAQVKYEPGKSFFDVKQRNGSSDFHVRRILLIFSSFPIFIYCTVCPL